MAAEGDVTVEMAASYVVKIEGIERTKSELKKLDGVIQELRRGQYMPGASISLVSEIGNTDLLVTKLDKLEGRVQTAAERAMVQGMNMGRDRQADALRAAVTRTGLSGRSHTKGPRNGPGRDDTGAMIKAISRSVEVAKEAGKTVVTGFHGWGVNSKETKTNRLKYFEAQEKGGSPSNIEAANSLPKAIIPVREFLKAELGKLKR